MEVLKREEDIAGKWRVLVSVAEGINQTFKFDHDPDETEIQEQVDIFLGQEINKALSFSEIERKINELLATAELLKQQLNNE